MKFCLLLLLGLISCASTSREAHPQTRLGAAIQGHDPVSYFEEGGGRPVLGTTELMVTHNGADYCFSSSQNMRRFEADPERYAPLYGGWCAYAMADGDKVDIDPESYIVTEEGLFLFYDSYFADTRKRWLEEGHVELKKRADEQWAKLERARLYSVED